MVPHLRVPHWRGAAARSAAAWPAEKKRRAVRLFVFGALVAVSCVLIGVATGLVEPTPVPVAEPRSPVEQVVSYAIRWRGPQSDPLITLPSGITVKSSNYRGVKIGDSTYYYNLAPRPSFDPLARGDLTEDQIRVIAVVGDAPNRVMIYTVKGESSSRGGPVDP